MVWNEGVAAVSSWEMVLDFREDEVWVRYFSVLISKGWGRSKRGNLYGGGEAAALQQHSKQSQAIPCNVFVKLHQGTVAEVSGEGTLWVDPSEVTEVTM